MKKGYVSIVFLFILEIYSCSKDTITTIGPPPPPHEVPFVVYTAGYVYDGSINAATYWKNDTAVYLVPHGTNNSFAYAIAVSGNDIYVAGSDQDGGIC